MKLWRKLRRRYQLARGTHWTQKRLSPAQWDVVWDLYGKAEPVPIIDPMEHIRRRQGHPTGAQMESAKVSFRRATSRRSQDD